MLVAEDDPGARDVLAKVLEDDGYRLVLAEDGIEAMACLDDRFDVVISDIKMPGFTGIDVLTRSREIAPATEVVITTAFPNAENAIACLRAGAFDFIPKPFQIDEVRNAVKRAIAVRRRRLAASLTSVSRAIRDAGDLDALPGVLVERMASALEVDLVSLLLRRWKGHLYEAYRSGPKDGALSPVTLAVAQRVADATGPDGPLMLPQDAAADPPDRRLAGLELPDGEPARLLEPLVLGEQVVAVLVLEREGREFDQNDRETATMLAAQMVLALQGGELVRRVALADRVAASMSHEVNNALTSVSTNANFIQISLGDIESLVSGPPGESLIDQVGSESARHVLERLAAAGSDAAKGIERIRSILHDVRLLTHVSDAAPERFRLDEVVRAAARLAAPDLGGGVRVAFELEEGLLVNGHPGLISQVIVNLLMNAGTAITESRKGQNVIVRTYEEGGQVVLEVSDDGPGIPAEDLPYLFQPYFTTKETRRIAGLGLTVCRDIIERHEGELSVVSKPGEGASFTVRLPAHA